MALPAKPSRLIHFGAFELDAVNGELRKAGVSLKMHPQPLRVLLLLAERPGQVVTREEIQRSLWGDNTFVDFERGINFCVNQIRTALGDDAEKPRYVETLPRRGYRFIATVAMDTAPDSPAANERISERPPGEATNLGTNQGFSAVAVPAGEPVTRLQSPTVPTRKRRYFLATLGLSAVLQAAKQNKGALFVGSLLLVTVVGYEFHPLFRVRHLGVPFQDFTIAQATDAGDSVEAAISPDGKYILSITEQNGKRGLFLRHIATGSTTQVVAQSSDYYTGPVFSPDGNYVYFLAAQNASSGIRLSCAHPS